MKRTILLNPGPVTLTERVRNALLKPDLCHREPEFAELILDIKRQLLQVYPESVADYDAIVLTGSGTCAVEAMLSSLVPKTGKALIVSNGVYGERMAAMLQVQGKSFQTIASAWHEPIDLEAVNQYLAQNPATSHVISVHHETTTGRLNDIAGLGKLCAHYQIPLLLDAVSSFAAEFIRFAEWNIEACAGTANKCLHGVPGLSFVLVKKSVFAQRPSAATSVYLDLYPYHREQQQGFSPFTQAVQIAYALQEALLEFFQAGGWQARHELYVNRAQLIRQELYRLGIEMLLNEADYSTTLTSFKLPDYTSYEQIYAVLKKQGFIIYAGQGGLKNKIFRIANMGDIQADEMENLLDCFNKLFA